MPLLISILLFSSSAIAQDAGAAPSPFAGLLPIVLIIGIFYLLIIRPQSKKYKEHKAMVEAISRGDAVVTAGGIHGKVTRVEEGGILKIQISEGVEVEVEQATITRVKSKTEPAKPANDDKKQSSSAKRKSPKAANDNG